MKARHVWASWSRRALSIGVLSLAVGSIIFHRVFISFAYSFANFCSTFTDGSWDMCLGRGFSGSTSRQNRKMWNSSSERCFTSWSVTSTMRISLSSLIESFFTQLINSSRDRNFLQGFRKWKIFRTWNLLFHSSVATFSPIWKSSGFCLTSGFRRKN